MEALILGSGFGFGGPLRLSAPRELREVPRGEPERLPDLLTWLDDVGRSGDSSLVAVGFLAYEAGVWLEGSRALFREPDRTPLALFGLFEARDAGPLAPHPIAFARHTPLLELDEPGFARGIAAIREGIARGDVYQVNLTRRVTRPGPADPLALASALHAENPVPYALALGHGDLGVVSNSPELLLAVAKGIAESRPIKGTIARGLTEEADAVQRARLLASEKDAAEHVMIVDLVRNDLGKVAVPGGVEVSELLALRTYRHLHHLESTVKARLATGAKLSDVLLAVLPGGSITGAPKRSALGFIRALEPSPRGPYTGAVGLVRGDGTAIFNVPNRTAIVSPSGVDYHPGGGIGWGPGPRAEWPAPGQKPPEVAAVMAGESG